MSQVNFLTSSPVHVTQRELIALSGKAKIIPLEPNRSMVKSPTDRINGWLRTPTNPLFTLGVP